MATKPIVGSPNSEIEGDVAGAARGSDSGHPYLTVAKKGEDLFRRYVGPTILIALCEPAQHAALGTSMDFISKHEKGPETPWIESI
jgi:hypothetical protein